MNTYAAERSFSFYCYHPRMKPHPEGGPNPITGLQMWRIGCSCSTETARRIRLEPGVIPTLADFPEVPATRY